MLWHCAKGKPKDVIELEGRLNVLDPHISDEDLIRRTEELLPKANQFGEDDETRLMRWRLRASLAVAGASDPRSERAASTVAERRLDRTDVVGAGGARALLGPARRQFRAQHGPRAARFDSRRIGAARTRHESSSRG
jgi:hypothetical protein